MFNQALKIFTLNSWKSMLLRGIALTLLGACFIIAPTKTLETLTWILGALFMFVGLGLLIQSSQHKTLPMTLRSSLAIFSTVLIGCGVIMMFIPAFANFMIIAVIAFGILANGIQQLMAIKTFRATPVFLVFSAFLSLALGILMLVAPHAFLKVLGLFVGIFILSMGVFMLTLSLTIRKKN